MRIIDAFQRTRMPNDEFLKRQLHGIASGAAIGYAVSNSLGGTLMGACAGINLVDPSSRKMKNGLITAIFSATIAGVNHLRETGLVNFDTFYNNPLMQISILTGVGLSLCLLKAVKPKIKPKFLFTAAFTASIAWSTLHVSKLALLGFIGLHNYVRYISYDHKKGIFANKLLRQPNNFRFISNFPRPLAWVCNFSIPLSAGSAITHALTQQNWVLKTWTILLFAPVFRRFPKKTITSLAFSTYCLWIGATEKQIFNKPIHWIARHPSLALKTVSSLTTLAIQFLSGSYIGNTAFLIWKEISSDQRFRKYLKNAVAINIFSLLCASYLFRGNIFDTKGIFLLHTAISCSGIFSGVSSLNNTIRRYGIEHLRTVMNPSLREDTAEDDEATTVEEIPSPTIPEDLLNDEVLCQYPCALTGDPVHHPVLDPTDGESIYEHSRVLTHLRGDHIEYPVHPNNFSSPATRQPLSPKDLIRLTALERFIESRIANPSAIDEKLQAEAEAELQKQKQLIQKYSCAISKKHILHPVLDPTDGVTLYERSAIMRALNKNRISPATGQELTPMQLIHLPALERFLLSHRENAGAINEELEGEAEAELESRQQKIQSRLSSKSD